MVRQRKLATSNCFEETTKRFKPRVWFHAHQLSKVIIYSPDTDTFLTRLPLISQYRLLVVVRVDTLRAKDCQYLDVNKLLDSGVMRSTANNHVKMARVSRRVPDTSVRGSRSYHAETKSKLAYFT